MPTNSAAQNFKRSRESSLFGTRNLGRTENAINLGRAKARETLDANLAARKARQEAQGMPDGFDLSKVQGIAMNELLERRAKAKAEDTKT